jgi:hypothetical protein
LPSAAAAAVVFPPPPQGRDYLRQKVDERHERLHIEHYQVLATAACPVDDTFFALVEVQYYDKVLGDKMPW